MGLSISDAIRLLMLRIADEQCLPFEVKVPNAASRKARAELEAGKGKAFKNVTSLMADLNADDYSFARAQASLQSLARKDPFRLGESQMVSGSCIHAGMSRWPCSTRQTSMCSGRST